MNEFSNNLSDGELERLALLAEEAGEVVQIVNKIIRHGYDSYSPFDDTRTSNKELLEKEIGDFNFAVQLLEAAKEVNHRSIAYHRREKALKVGRFLHHQNLIRIEELANEDVKL